MSPWIPATGSQCSPVPSKVPAREGFTAHRCQAAAALAAGCGPLVLRQLRSRTRRKAAPTRLQDTEIQIAMQLRPDLLRVAPADVSAGPPRGLQGDWLELFRSSAPYVSMFRQSIMVFHIPSHVLDANSVSELEGLIGDIALCAVLGVQPVLVLSIEQRVLERLELEKKEAIASGEDPFSVTKKESLQRILKQEAGLVFADVEEILGRLGRETSRNRMRMGGSKTSQNFSTFSSSQLFSTVQGRLSPAAEVAGGMGLPSPPGTLGAQVAATAGLLGRVHNVDVAQIRRRLLEQDVVCLTSLGIGAGGDIRYVPSEQVAMEAAKQLEATKLIFFTQGQRLVDTHRLSVVAALQMRDANAFIEYAQKHPRSFMDDDSAEVIGYIQLLSKACGSGTRRGHLIAATQGALLQELYTTDGSGTMVAQDLYDGIRLAHPGDVSGIVDLVEPLVQKGLLRRRSNYEVECNCNDRELFVWKRDDTTIGCALLHCFDDAPDMAELGCFVISGEFRGKGHGAVLLSYIERVARLQGLRVLFLLTTQTMQWFIERGFKQGTLDDLPPSKRDGYDVSRSSKVYVKKLDSIPSEIQERFTLVEVDTLD